MSLLKALIDLIKRFFVSKAAVEEKPKVEKMPIEFSPEEIELLLEPIRTTTSRLVYEGDEIEVPGYKWFSIVYTKNTPAVTFHPTKGYSTGVFPVKFKFTVEIPELNFKGVGYYEKYYYEVTDSIIEQIEYPKLKVPKIFGEDIRHAERILPESYFVNVSWEEFKISNVFYPAFVGGDNKFHPAVVRAGKCEKLQNILILPEHTKPWYRK